MASSPYFDSAGQQIDQSKAALLKAVAEGGTAGKQAFDAAQAQAAQAKQEAVARAAERSALYGVGGNDQTFLGAYDARANQGAVNRANFESGLAQTQASGESYLEKARASIPVLQSININKGADEETKIKLAIQAAKDKAAADLDKENRSLQRALDAEARAEARAIAREGRTAARDAAKAAAKPPTSAQLLGAGQAVKDQLTGAAQKQVDYARGNMPKPGQRVLPGDVRMQDNLNYGNADLSLAQGLDVADLARQIATNAGMDAATINSILTPMATGQWNKAPAPVKDAYAQALTTKYDTKGVSYQTALSAVNGQDFQTFVNWIQGGADGLTQDEAADKVRRFFINGEGRKGGNAGAWTAEYEILLGEYIPRLPKE